MKSGTKLYSRNHIKRINTWVVSFIRYSGPFLKWTIEELKKMNLRTELIVMVIRDDVDRLYVPKKEDCLCIDTTTRSLHRKAWRKTDYSYQNDIDNKRKNRMTITRRQND